VSRSRYCATLSEVARRAPCRYATLLEYRKLPGFPPDHSPGKAKYDLPKIQDWIRNHKSAHNYGGRRNGENEFVNERERGLIEKNRIATEQLRFDLQVRQGEYYQRVAVNRSIDTANAVTKRELYKGAEHELPPRLEGLNASEIKKALRKWLDKCFTNLPKPFQAKLESNGS